MTRIERLRAENRRTIDRLRAHRAAEGTERLRMHDPVTAIEQVRNGDTRVRHGWVVQLRSETASVAFGKSGSTVPILLADESITWIRGHHSPGSHALNAMLAAYKLVASARAA